MESSRKLSSLGVVIPCYNEEEGLPMLVEALKEFADGVECTVSFVLVDDGSRDASPQIMQSICQEDARFACLRLSRNFGHQIALSAGLAHVKGEAVAVLDADLQDPPAVVAEMIKEWEGGAEVVYGVRKNRKESLVLRGAFTIYYRLLKVIAHIDIPTDAGDFCLMDRKVLDQLNAMPERNRFIRGLRGWVGFKQVGLPYERPARAAGTTKYSVFRLFNLAMDGFTSFSTIPLRLSTWVGLLCSSVGFCLMVWAVFSRLALGNVVSGWTSLAVMLLFFSGVQLIMLGVIGEYLSRMFEEVKQRPLFVVESKGGWLDRSDSAQS